MTARLSTRFSPTRLGSLRSATARRVGAAAAVVSFFGAVVAAPLGISGAFAAEPGSVMYQTISHQQLTSEYLEEPMVDLSVAEAAEATAEGVSPNGALYSLDDFLFQGVINWGGHKFTFYSQQVLPGGGLEIPGRHVNAGGFVSDSDGYIVLAGSAPKGTVFDTPFGNQGKIYDRGTVGNHLDVYIR